MRPRAILLAVLVAASGATTQAQEPPRVPSAAARTGWLADYAFHLGLETLSGDDSRFQWDFDAGGDLDLLRTARGRVNFLFNYEGLLGQQLQQFDPIFNTYTIDVLGAVDVAGVELGARVHHVSVHLGDRPKPFLIGWNTLGGDATWTRATARSTWLVRGWASGVFWHQYVDYAAEAGADALAMRTLSSKVALVARGNVLALFVDEARSSRGTQLGGRVEGAVRLTGAGAAVEFYVGVDRRIDPDPLDPGPVTWALVGLRLVSR